MTIQSETDSHSTSPDDARSLTYQEKSVINLLNAHVKWQDNANDTLERKAQHGFSVVSIIIATFAAFSPSQIESAQILHADGAELLRIAALLPSLLIGLAYLRIARLSISVLKPREFGTFPMHPTREESKKWGRCCPLQHYDLVVNDYINIHAKNKGAVACKAKQVTCIQKLIVTVIGLVAVQAIVYIIC